MRVYMTNGFAKFRKKERIAASALDDAVARAETGLVDADLGGGLIKQRVARPGRGKSGGYRTVIAYRRGARAVFLYGFAKSDKDNIGSADLEALKAYGRLYLEFSEARIGSAVNTGILRELKEDG